MLNDVVIANKTYAKLNISNVEQLDEIAVKVMKQDIPEFLLPIKVINIDGEIEVRYELGSRTRMSYLPDSMTKQEFIILLENLVRPFKLCNDWFLDYHNFYLDKDYITIGKTYSDVKYVYIPDQSYGNDEGEILEFFRNLILNTNLKDDPIYVMNLYRRLNERGASLISILDYIANDVSAKSAPTPVPAAPTATPAPAPAPTSNSAENLAFGQDDMRGGLINNLFGDEEEETPKKGGGLFGAKKEKEKKPVKEEPKDKGNKGRGLFGGILGGKKAAEEKQEISIEQFISTQQTATSAPVQVATPVVATPYQAETDFTEIGGNDEPISRGNILVLELEADGGYAFPKCIEIDLSRGHATIGRYDKTGNPQADYNFDASLSFISRRHLRIEKRGEQCSIIDLAFEKNGTMLNGEVLAANMAYPVNSGDKIMFSKKHRITYRVL